ncbi:MAG: hypothetical protein JWR77_1263 [Rhizorhabdus sp.]|nr:hypothetical protein [Rhizorhabdus sp.]
MVGYAQDSGRQWRRTAEFGIVPSLNDPGADRLGDSATSPDARLTHIQANIDDGRYEAALAALAPLLDRGGDDAAFLKAGAIAAVACLDGRPLLPDWPERDRDALLLALIEQPGADPSPPALHHHIVSQHSAGIDVIDAIAIALRPTIERRLAQGEPERNLVLLLLLLRDSIDWIAQDRLSGWHRRYFAAFRYDDLAIPYNLMFEPRRFRANREDVRALGVNDPANPPANHLFASWLTDSPVTARPIALGRDSPSDREALHSLAVHAANPGQAPSLQIAALAEEVARTRATLRTACAGHEAGWSDRLLTARSWQVLQAARCAIAGKAPFVAKAGRRLKVAICVSGQLRGYRAALASWRRNLLPGIEPHIFVHSWRKIGRAGAEPSRSTLPFAGPTFTERYRTICHDMGLAAFRERYPTLFRGLDDGGTVGEAMLERVYRTPHIVLDDDGVAPFAGWSNQQKMHAKIEACFDMAVAQGDYDLIVRLRPDKPIGLIGFSWASLLRVCRSRPQIFADHAMGVHFATLMIGDQFAISAPEPMAVYSRTASLYDRFASHGLLRMPAELTGHLSLAQMCWLHDIAVGRLPMRFGALQDPERMAAADIDECLRADAAGRMDRIDRLMIDAIAADLKAA